jgi:hypothetical protein
MLNTPEKSDRIKEVSGVEKIKGRDRPTRILIDLDSGLGHFDYYYLEFHDGTFRKEITSVISQSWVYLYFAVRF